MVCMDLSSLNLTKLVDFDVITLAKEHKRHVNELADYIGEIQEESGNNEGDEMSDDDSEDVNFNKAEQEPIEEYDDTSLDEESFNSDEGLEDMELEFDTESRIGFGREIIHGKGDRNMVMNKMSRVFNKGILWSSNKDRSYWYLHLSAWFHAYFYIAANAYFAYVYEKAMEQIKEKDAAAYYWLRDTKPLEHWAKFKFDHILKCPDNTKNFVEIFNHDILNFRASFTLSEDIRKLVGGRYVKRFKKAQSWEGKVVPYVEKQLKLIEGESRNYSSIIHAGGSLMSLKAKPNDRFCDCQRWKISGVPCIHATRCILRMNDKLEDYRNEWSKIDKYRKLYDTIVHPISTPKGKTKRTQEKRLSTFATCYAEHIIWLWHHQKGRPKEHKRRDSQPLPPIMRSTSFGSGTTRCQKCKQLGHNSATCERPRDEYGTLIEKKKKKGTST
ncbi:LOW QUALITY PROTEIN: hypothetical protein Cgig2_032385 [Carnegiea gigantea]|uniref:SWIM-type domain-containing protein n=1 Tax=Carnegiea gigantea TaxID=171969 RepID=A0A9Q1GKP8_9CARY|nr:LOW QUALITY PROTEIN: hypothetical protein Cgig2_032385 [Carnegiea gigantea]